MADAKEFLRSSQGDLHIQLRALKAEYVDAVRRLGQEAKSFRIATLRDALENATAIQAEIRDDVIVSIFQSLFDVVGTDCHLIAELESRSFDIQEFAYQDIKAVIRKRVPRYTAKKTFQTIEARIARLWLEPPSEEYQVASGSDPQHHGGPGHTQHYTDKDTNVEAAVQREIDGLGFMLRASTTVRHDDRHLDFRGTFLGLYAPTQHVPFRPGRSPPAIQGSDRSAMDREPEQRGREDAARYYPPQLQCGERHFE